MSKATILDAAVAVALRSNYRTVTRKAIASKAKVATGTVSYHFGSMTRLRDAIIKRGVDGRLPVIVAQGLADKHRLTRKIAPDLKAAAIKLIAA
jgi:AcrR family transcriptional regulator